MTILCGTDFSELATGAAWIAAQLALRTDQTLRLVHVLDFHASELTDAAKRARVQEAEIQLQREIKSLGEAAARVEAQVLFGKPAEALVDHAREAQAQLLVVGAHGRAKDKGWHLGSQTELVAAKARVPFLVVRDDEPFRRWFAGSRALRVLLGADHSATTESAVDFVSKLRALGRCDVSALHLFWPPSEHHRLGFGGVRNMLENDPAVLQALQSSLAERVGDIPLEIEPHLGNVGDRLATLAAENRADLIVVGAHGRTASDRIVHGSVSRDVLKAAKVAVACLPLPAAQPLAEARDFHSALVAADFSELSDAALALACAAVPVGGTIHVVHVVSPHAQDPIKEHDVFVGEHNTNADGAPAREQLSALIARHPKRKHHTLLCYVLESHRPAEAIAQAAERLNVDLICLGTRGRGVISRAVLGSVSEGVMAQTHRPVLIAQWPER